MQEERFLRKEAERLEEAARRERSPSKRRMLESHALFYRIVDEAEPTVRPPVPRSRKHAPDQGE